MKPAFGKHFTQLPVILAFLIIGGFCTSCKKEYSGEDVPRSPEEKTHNLEIRFKGIVDDNVLFFDTIAYANFFDEPYTIKTFKFYIHGIELINTDSNRVFAVSADKYFLVDFEDPASTVIKLGVMPFTYNRLSFEIGVDSARNVSGAQTDALDPAKGMFWTWSTGYIMAKFEGNSPVAATPNNAFEYHIGGFRGADDVVKRITLSFPLAQTADLLPEKSTAINITANANAWFYNPHDIRLSVQPLCMTPGSLALQIAENYSKMFTVTGIINQ